MSLSPQEILRKWREQRDRKNAPTPEARLEKAEAALLAAQAEFGQALLGVAPEATHPVFARLSAKEREKITLYANLALSLAQQDNLARKLEKERG